MKLIFEKKYLIMNSCNFSKVHFTKNNILHTMYTNMTEIILEYTIIP